MRQPYEFIGPEGKPVIAQQLEQGDVTQAGDWFLVLQHCRSDWYPAEPNMRVREFHHPHLRIIKTLTP